MQLPSPLSHHTWCGRSGHETQPHNTTDTHPGSLQGRCELLALTPCLSTRSHWLCFIGGQREAGACQGHISKEGSMRFEPSSLWP